MRVLIGTSGYSYAPWRGRFYPKGLPSSQMLSFYAGAFGAVEINSTFYRAPKAKLLTGWGEHVPPAFEFALKAPGQITHRARLAGASRPTAQFFRVARALGPKLGPLLFQLPPNMKKDLERLGTFLSRIPVGIRVAFEFRHPSWFDGEVLALLRERGVAQCVAEGDGSAAPKLSTASWGYLRLRKATYSRSALARWADFVLAQPWSEAYVFFKHEDQARGPRYAAQLQACIDSIRPPGAEPLGNGESGA